LPSSFPSREMSLRATKRLKRSHNATTVAESRNEDVSYVEGSNGEDDSEEEIRRPGRRTTSKKGPSTPTKGRKLLLSHRKKRDDGLKQSALDFSKAKTFPAASTQEPSPSSTQEAKGSLASLEDDAIEDDDGDEFWLGPLRQPVNGTLLDRLRKTQKGRHQFFIAESLGRNTSIRNQAPRAEEKPPPHSLPWAQQYAPRSLGELGVHKRKVADVRAWIDNVLNGYERKRLLVLRGPSGSGKTAAVQVLSAVLGFSILEWRNPLTTATAWGEYRSGTASFEDFLSRGQRYGSLDLADSPDSVPNDANHHSSSHDVTSRRIILMEEDPQSYSHNTTVLQNFRSSLRRYLQAEESLFNIDGRNAATSLRNRPPIVMIISESANAISGPFSDTISAHRLLGPEILSHPRVTTIDFNPVASTILTKALGLVASRAQHEGAARVQANPAILQKIAESGDLRGAIGTLEFLSRRQDASMSHVPAKGRAKGKSKAATQALTAPDAALLDAIAPRSPMLDLFHAVGKVVYNKKHSVPPVPNGPKQSPSEQPTLVSEVDPDLLLDSTSHDPSTFTAALHENYILSCTGDSFVDHFNATSEAMSLSDILSTDPVSFRSTSSPAADAAHLRQSDLATHVAVRGLLQGLPYPVQRKGYGGVRDPFKMFWPDSVRLRGRMDEVKDRVRVWSAALHPAAGTGGGMLADTLLTEVPYRALIAQARGGEGLKELESIAGLNNSSWVTDGKTDDDAKGRRSVFAKGKPSRGEAGGDGDGEGMQSFIQGVDEKWVLSDDDIED
jgi:cell cycle checkpoint protein